MEFNNTTTFPGQDFNGTNTNVTASAHNVLKAEYLVKEWPQWVNITVPLICIIFFVIVMVIIFLKPSKPGDEPWCFFSRTTRKNPQVKYVIEVEEVELENGTRRPADYVPTEYC